MNIYGSRELCTDVIGKQLCIGCGACIDLCPYFRSYKGKTSMLFPCSLEQGRCFAYCPKIEVDLDDLSQRLFGRPYDGNPLGEYISIGMSRAGEKAGTGSYQAGGTVSALMQYALSRGHCDAAVVTDRERLLPVPRFVTTPEEVRACAASKYTAAPTLSALHGAMKAGFTRIGMVGTPCQVLATAQLRSNPMQEEAFQDPTGLVVGLFCTWALDYRAFESFLSARIDRNSIEKIDIPPPPSEIMEIFLTGGDKIEFPLSEIRKLVPASCSYCIDMTSEFSDISVGVMEGRPEMNSLIVRTERGRRIVEEAQQEGYLMLSEMPRENLEHLVWAAGNKKKRALLKATEEGIVNRAGEDRLSYLRINRETLDKYIL